MEAGKKFPNVIPIMFQMADGSSSRGSAVRVAIPGIETPLFMTSARYFEFNVMAMMDAKWRRADQYMIHPFYQLNLMDDVAFFTIPKAVGQGGYPLYMGDLKTIPTQSLVSVGYGMMKDGSFPRQAFYAGNVIPTDFHSLKQHSEQLSNEAVGQSSGHTTLGDRGGPLLMRNTNGQYEVVAIVGFEKPETQKSTWSLIDPHFIEAAVKVFGRKVTHQVALLDRTKEAEEYMLKKSGKTWDELKESLQRIPAVQVRWGDAYYTGDHHKRFGIAQDYTKAFEWYEEAAKSDVYAALYNLAHMYITGRGVKKDPSMAIELWVKLARQGDADAKRTLQKLGIHVEL